ncbi:phage portal protein family protein, partial [Kribbella catacumbae]|uniref:phage portal protein family protein n=1 Tax=Kribbella catacumbae TaxID=460086 RepID=UPI0003767EC9
VATGYEETPELMFPWSIAVYDRMRKTDTQVATLLRAITLPILSADWHLDDTGVEPEVSLFVRTELGLPDPDEPQARIDRQGIVWRDHLRMSLLNLAYGFMPFEQVYEIGGPRPDQQGIGLPLVAHLRKLGPRLPRTLTEVRVFRDGGLAGVVQAAPGLDTAGGPSGRVEYIGRRGGSSGDPYGDVYREVFIPENRLAMYVNEREGADWTGQSILRTAYKDWLIKDQLLRVGAQAIERNGMGLPVVRYDDNHSKEDALAIARAVRAGAHAGVALPDGLTLELLGVAGSTKDEMPRVNYHDQAVSKSGLAMFLDLGHDRGAQNLGETFLDFFTMALQATVDYQSDTTTDHVIRDLVHMNFGEGTAYPTITCSPMSSESTPTAAALKLLVDAGIIRPDDDLEEEVRRRHGLPPVPHYAAGAIRDVPVEDPADPAEPPAPEEKPTPAPTSARDQRPLRHGSPDDMLTRAAQLVDRIAELRRTPVDV